MADDHLQAEALANPRTFGDPERLHRLYRRLRQEAPVVRVEAPGYRPFWALTRHNDISAVEMSPDIFEASPRTVLLPEKVESIYLKKYGSRNGVASLTHMDGDEHRAHRAVTYDWFSPRNINSFSERVGHLAREFVDRMEDMGGSCDFAADIAYWYPLRVVMSLMGVPPEDEPQVLRMTQKLFSPADKDLKQSGKAEPEKATQEKATRGTGVAEQDAIAQFASYFGALAEERRRDPRNDIISTIANGLVDGKPMAPHVMTSYFIIVATAGHDTTAASLSGGLSGLMQFPEQLARLRQEPDLLQTAANEFVRWTAPVRHFLRTPKQNVTFRGVDIPAGDAIMLCFPSACRDEEIFPDGDQFRVDRPLKPQHLAFGQGGHFCLGKHLALMEIMAFYKELSSRLKWVESAGPASFIESVFVGGHKSLPITYRF